MQSLCSKKYIRILEFITMRQNPPPGGSKRNCKLNLLPCHTHTYTHTRRNYTLYFSIMYTILCIIRNAHTHSPVSSPTGLFVFFQAYILQPNTHRPKRVHTVSPQTHTHSCGFCITMLCFIIDEEDAEICQSGKQTHT